MKPADKTEIFLDRVKEMNKRSRLYRLICAGTVFVICFLQFAFMWGDMWGIWKDTWSRVLAAIIYISVSVELEWAYATFFFAQYIFVPGRDGKTGQSMVPHYVNIPFDVERMLLLLKKRFWRGIRYIIPLSLLMFTAELFLEFSEIDGNRQLVLAIPTAGRLFWFAFQAGCLLIGGWQMGVSLYTDIIKRSYIDKRTGYDKPEELEEKEKRKPRPAKRNRYKWSRKKRVSAGIFFVVLCVVIGYGLTYFLLCNIDNLLAKYGGQVEITTDIKEYQNVIGAQAQEPYQNKWMSEEIFPETICGNVQDFKMVYYDPWDAQYLAYLAVEYNEQEMERELKRLKGCRMEEYEGIYGAEGFLEDYELTAMDSDYVYGFVYALRKGNSMIYVEIMFCNFFMDIAYEKYIPEEYLPVGFDATSYNPYEIEQRKRMKEDEHYFDKSNEEG